MADYKPFLIQLDKQDSPVKDSQDWNIWVKHIPFKLYSKAKDIPSRSWNEIDGDDEFIPEIIPLSAYEIECVFVFLGQHGSANDNITSFLEYISSNGSFSIYDTYTKIGRGQVRYVDYNEDAFYRREGNNDIVQFKVTLKINNPRQNILLQNE